MFVNERLVTAEVYLNFSVTWEGRSKGCKAKSYCAQKHHLVARVNNHVHTILQNKKAEPMKAPITATGFHVLIF